MIKKKKKRAEILNLPEFFNLKTTLFDLITILKFLKYELLYTTVHIVHCTVHDIFSIEFQIKVTASILQFYNFHVNAESSLIPSSS